MIIDIGLIIIYIVILYSWIFRIMNTVYKKKYKINNPVIIAHICGLCLFTIIISCYCYEISAFIKTLF